MLYPRPYEERSDEASRIVPRRESGLLRCARHDGSRSTRHRAPTRLLHRRHGFAFSRLVSPELCCLLRLLRSKKAQGRPGAGLAPAVRRAGHTQKKLHSGIQVRPNARPSLRSGLTAYAVLLCPENLPECANGRFSQNRPSLDLSPIVLEGLEPVGERGTDPVVFHNPNSCMGFEPGRARKGVDDGTKRSRCRRHRRGQG